MSDLDIRMDCTKEEIEEQVKRLFDLDVVKKQHADMKKTSDVMSLVISITNWTHGFLVNKVILDEEDMITLKSRLDDFLREINKINGENKHD